LDRVELRGTAIPAQDSFYFSQYILTAINLSRERGMHPRFHVPSMTCTVSHHCPILPSPCEGAQSTSLDEMLGNQGVTESNMMQYLGEFKVQGPAHVDHVVGFATPSTLYSPMCFTDQASSNKELARYCKHMQPRSQGSLTARATASSCPHPTSSL
jgi:hypothetical protein